MSDEQAKRIIESESGYRRDLRDAELAIVAAQGDPVALATAFHRHAEAVRNMMIAEMIPSFKKALQPLLHDELGVVVSGIGGLQAGVSSLNDGFQSISEIVNQLVTDMAESKNDRASIHAEIAAVKADIAQVRNDFQEYQKGSKRAEVETMRQQIAELRGNFSDAERLHLTNVLLQIIREYEANNPDASKL